MTVLGIFCFGVSPGGAWVPSASTGDHVVLGIKPRAFHLSHTIPGKLCVCFRGLLLLVVRNPVVLGIEPRPLACRPHTH